MKHVRRAIGKVANKLPVTAEYLELKRLREKDRQQTARITQLNEGIQALQTRNDAWEAEVRQLRGKPESMKILWPVTKDDLYKATFKSGSDKSAYIPHKPPFVLNWVIPTMGETSGGHTTILRIINFLESRGFMCRLYVYDAMDTTSLDVIRERLAHYPQVKAEVFYNAKAMLPCDAVFATSWHTAYPVANYKGPAKKFYFVQDFEPFFDPVGSYSTLAENTYKFGLQGITIGSWLAEKLGRDYGMRCDSFEFGVDAGEYHLTNKQKRKEVLFYARPVTPRRGFELGILALEMFHKKNPDYRINLVGWDITPYEIPFPYVNHGILPIPKLNQLYNQCAAGLVLSLTNMSLLPLEMLASGCIPVLNDAHHTRLVGYADHLYYSHPTPQALADALQATATAKDQTKASQAAAEYAKKFQWDSSYEVIEQLLLRELAPVG